MLIQVETHEVTIIRRRGSRAALYCARCKQELAALEASETPSPLLLGECPGESEIIDITAEER